MARSQHSPFYMAQLIQLVVSLMEYWPSLLDYRLREEDTIILKNDYDHIR